jgi:hypothetical protein
MLPAALPAALAALPNMLPAADAALPTNYEAAAAALPAISEAAAEDELVAVLPRNDAGEEPDARDAAARDVASVRSDWLLFLSIWVSMS